VTSDATGSAREFLSEPAVYDFFVDEESRLKREEDLLRKVAAASSADRSGVLDVACGTGIHAAFFARLGYRVVARDADPEMIAYARAKWEGSGGVRWAIHDMAETSREKFGLSLCLGNSLSMLPDEDALSRTMKAVAEQLDDGGRFLFQILDYASLRADSHRLVYKPGEVNGRRIGVVKLLAASGDEIIASFLTLERQDEENGEVWACRSTVSRLSAWEPDDMRKSIAAAGLRIEEEYSAFSGKPFAPGEGRDYIAVAGR